MDQFHTFCLVHLRRVAMALDDGRQANKVRVKIMSHVTTAYQGTKSAKDFAKEIGFRHEKFAEDFLVLLKNRRNPHQGVEVAELEAARCAGGIDNLLLSMQQCA